MLNDTLTALLVVHGVRLFFFGRGSMLEPGVVENHGWNLDITAKILPGMFFLTCWYSVDIVQDCGIDCRYDTFLYVVYHHGIYFW
jgi:hypothetical protein